MVISVMRRVRRTSWLRRLHHLWFNTAGAGSRTGLSVEDAREDPVEHPLEGVAADDPGVVEGGEAPAVGAPDGDERLDRRSPAALVLLAREDRPAGGVEQRDIRSKEAEAVDLPDEAGTVQPGVEELLVLGSDRPGAPPDRAIEGDVLGILGEERPVSVAVAAPPGIQEL